MHIAIAPANRYDASIGDQQIAHFGYWLLLEDSTNQVTGLAHLGVKNATP
jgi:hypothetical protein